MNKKKEIFKINDQIRFPEVRLSGDEFKGMVCSTAEAIRIADERGLDLILIAEKANPPVCKIMDLKKFLYEKKKAAKEQEKKNKENRMELKEMRFKPHIEDHDFNFKKNHIIKFLKDNNKVKCTLFFRGREIMFPDNGKIVLLKMADEVSDYGVVESMPVLQGKNMIMIIKPIKSTKSN